MGLARDLAAAMVAEPELSSGAWCRGDCNGLMDSSALFLTHKSVVEFLYWFCSIFCRLRMRNFEHGFLVAWGVVLVCLCSRDTLEMAFTPRLFLIGKVTMKTKQKVSLLSLLPKMNFSFSS